jgi:hypothetical protein
MPQSISDARTPIKGVFCRCDGMRPARRRIVGPRAE